MESALFPGLRLHVPALLAGDLATVIAELQRGLASPADAALRARLLTGLAEPTSPTPQ
jgi:hypothetical protein